MREHLPQPKVIRSSQSVLSCYEFSQRTNTVAVYPIESSNGSTVILFGLETGIKIIWRGGRPFKTVKQPSKASTAPQKVNGLANTVLLLDSDDEVTPVTKYEDHPEFEEEEEEEEEKYRPSSEYNKIVQVLDLNFESSVLQLGVLSSSILKSEDTVSRKNIVFVAACDDKSIRFVTLPIIPPSFSSKSREEFHSEFSSANAGFGKWGEKVLFLNGHNKVSNGVSLTIDHFNGNPYYIIASHSHELNGRLLLWRISLNSESNNVEPFISIYLSSPARSISFNPSIRRPRYLLVAEGIGVCRIFYYDVSKSQASVQDTLTSVQGHWLLSLFTGFPSIKNKSLELGSHAGFGRKPLIDAQWVLDGCAIIVLLNDGEWGIWDIEGSGVGTIQGILSNQGLKGGSQTEFSFSGVVSSSINDRPTILPKITASKFAPMTPGRRKSTDPFSSQELTHAKGQIAILDMTISSSTRRADEAVLFRLGENYAIIPNIAKYWALHTSNDKSASFFNSSIGGRIINLQEINLQGEHCSGAVFIPSSSKALDSTESVVPEIVILGEHRFVILSSDKRKAPSLIDRSTLGQVSSFNSDLIESEDLDVTNIEMALEQMVGKNRDVSKKKLFAS